MEIAGRDIERTVLVQIGAGTGSILVFIALVTYVGIRYTEVVGTDPKVIDLTATGGLAMVVVLTLFVAVLSVVGLALSDELSDDDE
jgi:hypothetical protein